MWGCRKDVEEFQPYAASVGDLGSLFSEQVPSASSFTTFTLSFLSTDKVLETANGTRVFLIDTDNLFYEVNSGQPVLCSTCPELKIEITEVLNKPDIIGRGLNTISDDGTLFESGGMVRVTASCNGKELAIQPDRNLKIQLPNNNQQSGFFVFNQIESANTQGRWANNNQEVYVAEWPTANGLFQGYELLVKKLGWSACGRPNPDTSSLFCLELPKGFADQNTLAFLVFKNQQTIVPLHFDLGKNNFCHTHIPAGYQVQIVAVSKLGNQYWLGKAETEVGTNTNFQLSTQQTTQEAVLNFVKSL